MSLRALLAFGSLLLIGTGCPHDWVKDGTNDRAMAKDLRDMLDDEEECPEGMTVTEDCSKKRADGTCLVTCR
jgi:hypothetical protein